ncbi:hypothetical protein PhaeoP97_01967 [Phaeobacter porticola]|uniref:DUF2474 domain-containing protein n=1 Tax=Phaeobacter porticola TaxID=1844006 RepID=A0A1L3I5J1_9RHOB|nr:hypothetical protein PhaeoP97_01967 [Phaeobacter porticola]
MQGKPEKTPPDSQIPLLPAPGAENSAARLLWFAAIWIASVGVLACVAYVIRWAVMP